MINVSVIMPVYNVQDYLIYSVRSMTNQSLKDIEIILVDDGSEDDSGKIADALSLKDERIKVIHKKNNGAAAARNSGMEIALGKYLYFMDPDDTAKREMLSRMFVAAEKNSAQMVMTGFTNIYMINNKKLKAKVIPEEVCYLDSNSFRNNFYKYINNTVLAVPWNKLYLAEYLNSKKLVFPQVRWDDLHFNMEVVKDIERVIVINDTSYQFLRERNGSETTKVFDRKLFYYRKQQFSHILKVYNGWDIINKKSDKGIYYYFASRVVECIQEISSSSLSKMEKINETKKVISDPLAQISFEKQEGPSKMMTVIIYQLKMQNIRTALFFGKIFYILKKYFLSFFIKAKIRIMRLS
ncbi:conserved hypothetical protein [Oenococcus oeni]|uniref:glycosyltransferase family 2 protein n=1 Tax=Oenococcus oeni TaxID=1247 RepID=UPI0010B58A3F|nr:glycosyltransferase family 2 protein [Oenococcus oeni]SYW05551.1 conserved hypothetical protein [Oenococcus oeni]